MSARNIRYTRFRIPVRKVSIRRYLTVQNLFILYPNLVKPELKVKPKNLIFDPEHAEGVIFWKIHAGAVTDEVNSSGTLWVVTSVNNYRYK